MNIDITNSIEEARTLLAQEKNISPALRVSITSDPNSKEEGVK